MTETQATGDKPLPNTIDVNHIVFFDGECGLCDGTVHWLLAHDRKRALKFSPIQSSFARRFMAEHGQAKAGGSVTFYADGALYFESDAVLKISMLLPAPWDIASVGWVVPRGGRDAVYRFIARNRYRWFGKKLFCTPTGPEFAERFLTDNV